MDEHSPLSFTATATDGDDPANNLIFSLTDGPGSVPDGATINPITGLFSWTPSESHGPGTYWFNVVVTDDGTPILSGSQTITITVNDANAVPESHGVPDPPCGLAGLWVGFL